jgi:hypothetical protein
VQNLLTGELLGFSESGASMLKNFSSVTSYVFVKGLVPSLLHADRAAPNLINALKLLIDISDGECATIGPRRHALTQSITRTAVAPVMEYMINLKIDDDQKGFPLSLRVSQTALLEILAKHLVDRRVDLVDEDVSQFAANALTCGELT